MDKENRIANLDFVKSKKTTYVLEQWIDLSLNYSIDELNEIYEKTKHNKNDIAYSYKKKMLGMLSNIIKGKENWYDWSMLEVYIDQIKSREQLAKILTEAKRENFSIPLERIIEDILYKEKNYVKDNNKENIKNSIIQLLSNIEEKLTLINDKKILNLYYELKRINNKL